MTDEPRLADLRGRLNQIEDLRRALFVLYWDLETKMPSGGAEVRGEQLGTLERLRHERFVSDEIGALLEDLRVYESELDYDSDDASLIRVARREYERARRVPTELRGEMVRAAVEGNQTWKRAREENDYSVFRPALERNLELQGRYIECLDGNAAEPYDVLIAESEPGLTTADIAPVFGRLGDELAPLVADLVPLDDSQLELGFTADQRRATVERVLGGIGWDRERGRVDTAVHPFMISFGTRDVRLTVYEEGDLRALYAALHEFGHGLYELGIDPALERTLLAAGASGAVHESQSLLWENLVGRGRPFCAWLARELALDAEELYRAVNRVERSLIRVDADPVTYSLHVIFRFELERELVAGKLAAVDLRDAWNSRVEDYFGLPVPDDLRGVLQDMHWSDSLMGYFPSYALGHVASAQIWERASGDLPDLDEQIERGEFAPLTEWLQEHVHRHGRKFTTLETMERAAGGGFDPAPLLRYVRTKLDS